MIKLTDEQIQILENNGYEQAPNYYNVENFPWFKELVNDGGISLEIIVNPLNNEQNVLVGCTVEDEAVYESAGHIIGNHNWINLLNAIGVSANIEYVTDEEMEDMIFEEPYTEKTVIFKNT